jgi:microcystin-dependent protein
MALSGSNTFVLPSQGVSISISRSQFNSSLRSILQNFYSSSTPDTENLQAETAALTASEYDGMFYRNSTTGVLYISDSSVTPAQGRTNNPVGGNFTRYGIAWRQQGSLVAAASNISSFDIGDAFAIVKDTSGSANNSVWLRVGTTGTFNSDFINLRTPQSDTITAAMLTAQSVTGPKLNATMRAIPTTTMEHTSAVTITPRIVVSSFANNQTIATSAAIELKTATVTNDVALGFNNGTKNAAIKMIPGNTGDTDRGVGIYTTAAALAPIRANLIVQSTITGSTSETAAPLIPAGVVVAWSGSTAPSGWLECAGSAISRTAYAALYAVCGTAFGSGNGSTTFNLPDIRGRAIYGTSASVTRAATSTAIGSSFTNTSSSESLSAHSLTTASTNSTTDKDVTATINAVTAVADHSAHTHTITHPGISMMYIIKT